MVTPVLTTNLPSKRIFRASRSNSFYLVLLLLMLLVIMLPIVYSLFSIKASTQCGPFSNIPEVSFSYEIVNWTITTLNVSLISSTFKMVMSPTVILPCLLVMIMTIYYLYGASKGKDYALTELKQQLLNEREDYKKRVVQAAAQNELSGRKSVSAKRMSVSGIRRASIDNTLRLQPSLAPSLETRFDQSPTQSVFQKEMDTQYVTGPRTNLGRSNAFRSNSSQPSTKSSDTIRSAHHHGR